MGMSKTIIIDGIAVPFKASAAIPRLYRLQFRRDLFHDFADLQKSVDEEKKRWRCIWFKSGNFGNF